MELTPEQQQAWIVALQKECDAYLEWVHAKTELDALRKKMQSDYINNESRKNG